MDDSTLKILAIAGRRDSLPVLRAGTRETSPNAQLSVALERPTGSGRTRLDGSDQILLDPVTEEGEKVRTQQHATVESLGEDPQWYQAIFEQAGDCLLLLEVGPDGIPLIVDVNESGLRVHGYTRAELVGRPISLLEPAWTPEVSAARQRSTREGRGLFPVRHRRKDGSFFDAEARAGVIHAGTRTLFLTVERDITEQKRTPEQALQQWTELLHLSRLSTLGEMAAELAHELNQPLSAIATYGGACLRQAQAPAPDWTRLVRNQQRVLEQALRAREIMGRIRAFAARRPPQMIEVTVGEAVRSAVALVQGEMRHRNIEVRLKLENEQAVIHADVVTLGQVLVNLLRNAMEALEPSGSPSSVALETRVTPARQVEVRVSDSGPGVSEEDLPRLFDPFFTTKATGLGLGLSLGRRIVEMHGGTLAAKRNPDGGMTFLMTLPLAPREKAGE
jgi:two-component system sensor kinase FixL